LKRFVVKKNPEAKIARHIFFFNDLNYLPVAAKRQSDHENAQKPATKAFLT